MKIAMPLNFTQFIFCFLCLWFLSLPAHSEEITPADLVENTYAGIILSNGLVRTLNLSPILINVELKKLTDKKLKISNKEQEKIKLELLARFHPEVIKKTMLARLQDAENSASQNLFAFYQSELATQIIDLQNTHLNAEHQNNLLAYQKKLSALPTQNHRRKLISVLDDLNYQSQWQAALLQSIQESVYASLPVKTRAYYILSTEKVIEQNLSEFNAVVNLYSLRHIPSEQLIEYLDGLNSSKSALQVVDIAYRETLQERKDIKFTLEK